MLMCVLDNQNLRGGIEFHNSGNFHSYVVKVYRLMGRTDAELLYSMSFNDGVRAEDRLLELLEHPAWTILKYGK